jgi:hypothetical protein
MAHAAIVALQPNNINLLDNPVTDFLPQHGAAEADPIPNKRRPPTLAEGYYRDVARYVSRAAGWYDWDIIITGEDVYQQCQPAPHDPFAYHSTEPGSNKRIIHLCPTFFLLPAPKPPCAEDIAFNGFDGMGGVSSATVLFHEILSCLPSAVRNGLRNVKVDGKLMLGTQACWWLARQAYDANRNPLLNIDSHVWAASWSRDLGLHQLARGGRECIQGFAAVRQRRSHGGLGTAGEYPSMDGLTRLLSGELESSASLGAKSRSGSDEEIPPWVAAGVDKVDWEFDRAFD